LKQADHEPQNAAEVNDRLEFTLDNAVDCCFEISGRGCVVVPGIPRDHTGPEKVSRGSPITLKLPNGQEIPTHIKEIEFVLYSGDKGSDVTFVLPDNLRKEDVPIGTEIWIQEEKG